MTPMTRRQMLASLSTLGALALRPWGTTLAAQPGGPAIKVKTLNHFGITVADPKRAIDFYQGLFGMPIQARLGNVTILRVGAGPQYLSIRAVENGAAPGFTHFGLGIDGFAADRVLAALASKGVTKADALAPMKAVTSMRDGTAELRFGDPDGIVCQLQDAGYCGGSGPLGNQCKSVTASPSKGLIALADLSHLTIFPSDAQRSNQFYQDLFGLSIRSYQGPTAPTLAVGPTTQFLMFAGGAAPRGGATPRPASINHACWSLDAFKPDEVTQKLESFGLKPREAAPGPVGPLRHYVTMRLENRGGAPGAGTPELYFTDPDGLLMQLQDSSYCGGGGFLGSECTGKAG